MAEQKAQRVVCTKCGSQELDFTQDGPVETEPGVWRTTLNFDRCRACGSDEGFEKKEFLN